MTKSILQRVCKFGQIAVFACFAPPAFAGCIDLSNGNSFSLVRNEPHLAVTNTISGDGSVVEEREMSRNGAIQSVTTTYWNGIIAVDRKSASSHIQLRISNDAKLADLGKTGRSYSFPVTIIVNGNEIDRGDIEIRTVRKTNITIGGCRYSAMVVRTTTNRANGDPINEEALLSLDAGMLLGNTAMTPDWHPRSGVYFDEIRAN